MENFILVAVLGVIIVSVVVYIVKAKKKGVKCIGCPDSKTCSGNCGNCQYSCNEQEK